MRNSQDRGKFADASTPQIRLDFLIQDSSTKRGVKTPPTSFAGTSGDGAPPSKPFAFDSDIPDLLLTVETNWWEGNCLTVIVREGDRAWKRTKVVGAGSRWSGYVWEVTSSQGYRGKSNIRRLVHEHDLSCQSWTVPPELRPSPHARISAG